MVANFFFQKQCPLVVRELSRVLELHMRPGPVSRACRNPTYVYIIPCGLYMNASRPGRENDVG